MISYQTHLQSSNHTLAVIGSSEIFAEDDQDKGLDSDHDEAQSDGHEDDENKAANGQLNQKKKKPRSKLVTFNSVLIWLSSSIYNFL